MKPILGIALFAMFCTTAGAQSPRKDIPSIAKAANGAIVTIVMANNDKPIALGTGFLVTPDGVVVTNYHVIQNGDSAAVKFPDGTVVPVDGVLAADKVRDLAVIKIHGKSFHVLSLGNSDRVQVGEEVVAIGNPLSLESTVSNGIISGVRIDKEAGGKFLQITAPITHGSSGGPLFNMMGEVVGITTLGIEGAGNLNFAIPVNDARRLLELDSFKPHNFPNEPEPTKSEKRAHAEDAPPSTGTDGLIPEMNSPAYHYYLELLKSPDMTAKVGTYACFDDNQQSKAFKVIFATLLDKENMTVITSNFVSGVAEDPNGIFSGTVEPFAGGIMGTLATMFDVKNMPSHETDAFEWRPDVLTMKTGFGKTIPGQPRISYEFKMQRSTGRYTEHVGLDFPDGGSSSSINSSGKCVKIPNSRTPEDTYRSLK
jgi:V8-like Glu-specific endopeptidase